MEKDSGLKLRMLVRLLSGMSFSHFGELWPRGGSLRWDMRFADAFIFFKKFSCIPSLQ